jgi:hypothetical protein
MVNTVCGIAETACSTETTKSYADVNACTDATTGLGAIGAQWGSKLGSAASGEDTLECRVYHVIAGHTVLNTSYHCGHYGLTGGPCSAAPTTDATHYCETLQKYCVEPQKQFTLDAQCSMVAAGYSNTPNDARISNVANSLGCRQYHAQAAASNAALHCEHAGPSGHGFCGTIAEAWGSMLAAAPCSDKSVQTVVNNTSPTLLASAIPVGIASTDKYNTTFDTSLNTQVCRLYHLGVASTATDHCSHGSLSGGDFCGKRITNLCAAIGAVCSWGTASHQFASSSACVTALNKTTIMAGLDNATAGNTLGCRFYHLGVAASYSAGGSMAGATGAAALVTQHCSHVLETTPTGGCNVATTTPPSSASALPVLAGLVIALCTSLFL